MAVCVCVHARMCLECGGRKDVVGNEAREEGKGQVILR